MSKRIICLITLILCPVFLSLSGHPVLAANQVERIYGMNKYQTAVQVAYKINPGIVQNVVLVNGNSFADALAGVPLARQLNAPLLYLDNTPEASVDALSYIQNHMDHYGQLYLLGGTGVIPESFVDSLGAMGYNRTNVHRLAGADRYATAVEVAKQMQHDGTEFFVASGDNFPDALSASVAASLLGTVSQEEADHLSMYGLETYPELGGVPLLLLPSDGTAPDSVVNYLNSLTPWLGVQAIDIVGGESALSSTVVQNLKSRMNYPVIDRPRYQGINRYATNAAINRIGFEIYYSRQGKGSITPHIYVATGENYADALTGAVLAAQNHAPLVLVTDPVPLEIQKLLSHYASENALQGGVYTTMTVIGNYESVSDPVIFQLQNLF